MNSESKIVILKGEKLNNYMITEEGVITSVFGNTLKPNDKGRVVLKVNGKRHSASVQDIISETFHINSETEYEEVEGGFVNSHNEKTAVEEDPLYYDTETKNESFIKMYDVLKSQGVENNKFFLALHNKDLLGINPHKVTLTKEIRLAIIEECVKNPWYFLREVVRVLDLTGKKIPFVLNQANLANIYLSVANISSYTVTPHETYRRESACAITAWCMMFSKRPDISLSSFSRHSAEGFFNKVQELISTLPIYLRKYSKDIVKEESADSVKYRNETNGADVIIQSTPRNNSHASINARSNTASIQIFDEFESIKHNAYSIIEGVHTFEVAKSRAIFDDKPSFRMLISGVGSENETKDKFISAIIDKSLKWSNIFYDTPYDELIDHIYGVSRIGLVYIEFGAEYLVDDVETYYKRQEEIFKHDSDRLYREVYLIRQEFEPVQEVQDEFIPVAEEEYFMSIHEWYEGTDSSSKAVGVYETIDTSLFKDGIPAVVLNDMALDGHDIQKELDRFMVRAYTIRHITSILETGVIDKLDVVYDNEYDTYFAMFGVVSTLVVESLIVTNMVANKLYMGTMFAALPLLATNPEVAVEVSEAGPFSAKSFHIMINLINSNSTK